MRKPRDSIRLNIFIYVDNKGSSLELCSVEVFRCISLVFFRLLLFWSGKYLREISNYFNSLVLSLLVVLKFKEWSNPSNFRLISLYSFMWGRNQNVSLFKQMSIYNKLQFSIDTLISQCLTWNKSLESITLRACDTLITWLINLCPQGECLIETWN